MAGWTKLHSRIVKSSIWSAPDHVRILWITMLAEADADGFVDSSVPGLARIANLSLEQTKEGLDVLLSPDPYSSDQTTGERIITRPGGWWIKNHKNYRDVRTQKQEATAERVRRFRERHRDDESVTCNDVTPGNAPQQEVTSGSAPASSSSSSSSSSEQEKRTRKRAKPAKRPEDISEELWQDWCDHRRRKRASMGQTVIDSLRRKAERAQLTLAQALEIQITNGWQGFEAHWLDGKSQQGKIPKTTPQNTYNGPTIDDI